MDPHKAQKNRPDEEPLDLSEEMAMLDAQESGLDTETGMVEGRVSEVASEQAAEQSKGGQKSAAKKEEKKAKPVDLSDRMALRERLLENAPRESTMRSEVKRELEKQKVKLEADVAHYRRKKKYHLLSKAIMELRLVIRQLEEIAKASYEVLKEVWLKVVQHFA